MVIRNYQKKINIIKLLQTLNYIYFLWTISEKFGLYAVNMTSPRRERTPKESAGFFGKLIETRQIP